MSFGGMGGGGGLSLTPGDQAYLGEYAETREMKAVGRTMVIITERCFDECVSSFKSRSLDAKEQACVQHCTSKFMQHMRRVQTRFAEFNMAMQQQQAASMARP